MKRRPTPNLPMNEDPLFDLPDDQILPLSKEHVFWTWSAQGRVNPIPVKTAILVQNVLNDSNARSVPTSRTGEN